MNANREQEMVINLRMTLTEAEWLKGAMQNPILHSQSCCEDCVHSTDAREEDADFSKKRRLLYDTLKDTINLIGLLP